MTIDEMIEEYSKRAAVAEGANKAEIMQVELWLKELRERKISEAAKRAATNRALIESMTDAELAESLCYLGQLVCGGDCEKERNVDNCKVCYLNWLESEIEM